MNDRPRVLSCEYCGCSWEHHHGPQGRCLGCWKADDHRCRAFVAGPYYPLEVAAYWHKVGAPRVAKLIADWADKRLDAAARITPAPEQSVPKWVWLVTLGLTLSFCGAVIQLALTSLKPSLWTVFAVWGNGVVCGVAYCILSDWRRSR